MNFHHIFHVKEKKTYVNFDYSFNSLSCRGPSFLTPFKKSFIKIGSVLLAGEFPKKHSTPLKSLLIRFYVTYLGFI